MYFMLITNKIEYTKLQNVTERKMSFLRSPDSLSMTVRLEGAQLQGNSAGCSNAIAFQTSLHSKALLQKQYTLYKTIN